MTISRVTRDGRRLHYDLQVLQQPERARACGSGPKCETKQYLYPRRSARATPTDWKSQLLPIADRLIHHPSCK